jgi:peptide/nickel transport system permease protein
LQLFLVIFIAATINFALPHMLPGNPIEVALQNQNLISGGNNSLNSAAVAKEFMGEYGLNKPLVVQYLDYWDALLHGNLGVSLVNYPEPVTSMIKAALPWTLGLLTVSVLLAFVLGSLLGAVLAWPRTPRSLKRAVPGLMVVSVVPYYLIALVLIYVFATRWQVLPGADGFDPIQVLGWNWPSVTDVVRHAILPALSIILGAIGFWALAMRGTMISVLGEDYMTFAEAKGLSPRRIFFKYGMRNALLPQTTQLAVAMGFIVSGAVLVEVIFNYPGLGYLLYVAIEGKDYFVIQGIVLLLVVALAVALYVVDLAYPLLDPRISYRRR